jgi:DOPA 4,5-dioxygenase
MGKLKMEINDYHIHLYFNDQTIDIAKNICAEITKHFPVQIGRFHEKNVGPHPRWSVQILIEVKDFGDVLSWVAMNRQGLTVFTHPNTGNDLLDHKNHAIWMGEVLNLNLSIF